MAHWKSSRGARIDVRHGPSRDQPAAAGMAGNTGTVRVVIATILLASIIIGLLYAWKGTMLNSAPPARRQSPVPTLTGQGLTFEPYQTPRNAIRAPATVPQPTAPQIPPSPRPAALNSPLTPMPINAAQQSFDLTIRMMLYGNEADRAKNLALLRNGFLADTSDPVWSQTAASQTQAYLATALEAQFGPASVKCGRRLCEIQVSGGSPEGDEQNWHDALSTMTQQPWWQGYGFATALPIVLHTPDGQTTLAAFLTRNGAFD